MTKRKIILYDPKLKFLARKLRKNSTLAEVLLWNHLKAKQMRGYQFLRQKPLYNYIVDFFCYELMLAIEVDGVTHDYKPEYDAKRQYELESHGIRFIRIHDIEILQNIDAVLQMIEQWIINHEDQVK